MTILSGDEYRSDFLSVTTLKTLSCLLGFIGTALTLLGLPERVHGQSPADGLYLRVPNPLTSESATRMKNQLDAALNRTDRRPSVIVFDFNPGDKDASGRDWAASYSLAKTINEMTGVSTVAYVHRKVTGHTVLAALACGELVMGPAGAIGEIVSPNDPRLTLTEQNGYTQDILRNKLGFQAVVRKMFDKDVKLRKGKKAGANQYVDLRDRERFEKEGVQVTDTQPLAAAPDGVIGIFSANQLRDLGLSRKTLDSRRDVLDTFGLTAAALRTDPLGDRAPVAFHYVMRGAVDAGVRESVGRVLKDIGRAKGNILFLELECQGGDLQAARDLADDLKAAQTPPEGVDPILVVAFITNRAPDTAAIIALGCTEIVMSKRTDANDPNGNQESTIGDFASMIEGSGKNLDFWIASLRQLAEEQGYPPVLIDAMLNRDIEIVYARKKTNRLIRKLMTDEELRIDRAKGVSAEWDVESAVKPKGQFLILTASQAEQYGLARYTTNSRNPTEVYARFGVEPTKVREATPAWLDRFADFLKIPAVTVLLVVIGFTGLILELKVPGTTVPGILAALCFILVFWAHTQFSGQVAVLAGLLFILGIILVLMEVFILPGFGAAGVSGILFMLAALGLATFGSVDGGIPQTAADWGRLGAKMAQYLLAMIGSLFMAFTVARYLPNIPYANRLMLTPPAEKPEADEPELPGAAEAASLLGAVGTAVTVLRPAGTVRFTDSFIDVVTEGGFLPSGARVQVIEVEGTRIVVKEV